MQSPNFLFINDLIEFLSEDERKVTKALRHLVYDCILD